jgi:Transposase DDE domain
VAEPRQAEGREEVRPGEEFEYVFDLGDNWRHRCTVEPEKGDPVEEYGIVPNVPAPIWGWGSIPDQYGRRAFDPDEEWLICEWPEGHDAPLDYWISNLPADTPPEHLARLARMRWQIELDYKQLKGELGLDHYEGRSWLGWYHHTALVTAAHGFLTL